MLRIILNSRSYLFVIFCLLADFSASGQIFSAPFSKQTFDSFWFIESESPNYSCTFLHDTLEIKSPKGLTLWFKQKICDPVVIDYDACIMKENDSDRLSDLNCFWMASDSKYGDIWKRAKWRSGNFNRCYSLRCYYLGYGGNNNTTTRFRKYDGDMSAFETRKKRPDVIVEYKDSNHLLKANHWYHIHIEAKGNHIMYVIDNNVIVKYYDIHPLRRGWYGFRTTLSRTRISHFKIKTII